MFSDKLTWLNTSHIEIEIGAIKFVNINWVHKKFDNNLTSYFQIFFNNIMSNLSSNLSNTLIERIH